MTVQPPSLSSQLDAVRVGGIAPLPPEGQPSAIDKQVVEAPVRVTQLGLAGDHHGDPRVHGGPEQALHYFSTEGYDRLADALPDIRERIRVGVLGENLGGRGLTESDVCIGDIFRVGTALAQVSRPRTPCWKVDNRLGWLGANLVLAQLRCQGWYLRVLEEGEVGVGDRMTLTERPSPGASIDRILDIQFQHRPDPAELRHLAAATGLDAKISRRLLGRAQWIEANS